MGEDGSKSRIGTGAERQGMDKANRKAQRTKLEKVSVKGVTVA